MSPLLFLLFFFIFFSLLLSFLSVPTFPLTQSLPFSLFNSSVLLSHHAAFVHLHVAYSHFVVVRLHLPSPFARPLLPARITQFNENALRCVVARVSGCCHILQHLSPSLSPYLCMRVCANECARVINGFYLFKALQCTALQFCRAKGKTTNNKKKNEKR